MAYTVMRTEIYINLDSTVVMNWDNEPCDHRTELSPHTITVEVEVDDATRVHVPIDDLVSAWLQGKATVSDAKTHSTPEADWFDDGMEAKYCE